MSALGAYALLEVLAGLDQDAVEVADAWCLHHLDGDVVFTVVHHRGDAGTAAAWRVLAQRAQAAGVTPHERRPSLMFTLHAALLAERAGGADVALLAEGAAVLADAVRLALAASTPARRRVARQLLATWAGTAAELADTVAGVLAAPAGTVGA